MRYPTASPARLHGVTVIEMMIVIAVMGILASIAIPSFTGMITSQRIRSAASDGYAALMFTRSEAMKRNTTVALTANDAHDWTQGWKVTVNIDGTDTDIFKQNAFGNGLVVAGPVSGSVGFLWTGRPDSSSTGAQLRISSSTYPSSPPRCITLSLNGMPESKLC